jgi:ATP-dependent helicase/nuclease subunit A
VSDSGVIDLPLPDAPARARVAIDLDANILVEAGAGSGKTTALVGRLVALVATGAATVDEIAAVTFTRKAASELRERFQTGIESRLREERAASTPDELTVDRLRSALDDIDRAFVGTIHSFCGRLLRERPLEIGLDPGFQEMPVEERGVLRRRFWESYLERLARDSDPILEDLARAGLRPSTLFGLFDTLVENPDVLFPADAAEAPSLADVGAIRGELEEIVERGWELMDDMPPAKGWDSLQKKIRQLHFEREITGWKEPTDLFGAVALLCKPGPRGHNTTLNRWRDGDLARSLRDRVDAFGVGDTPAQRLVDRWFAHRYALAIRLGRAAAEEFAAHRKRIGKLDFQDLLLLAARLLRTRPDVRRELGRRYCRLLVDEFQDTDPLQAEIMLLLSSDPEEPPPTEGGSGTEPRGEADWRTAVPRAGALFVVGDPKQSIYRFRRADIQLYGFVKERFAEFGEVVALSTNFRSRPPVGDLVNALFRGPDFFAEQATREQAAFERLETRPAVDSVPAEGVFTYEIEPDASRKDSAATDDAMRLATWIRDRVDAGERVPEDFLILTRDRGQISSYARALEAHALPVQVTGAGIGVEDELRELEVVLGCMIDPTHPVKVIAALVGLFFGIDYERLVEHRLEGGSLDAMAPGDRGHPDVLEALRTLHAWWRGSTAEPADVFVGRLAARLGLLPYAAAGDLGTLRAGALLYALDAVRAAALGGDTSLPGALEALRAALELKEAEAPLEPGRPDAVRLMNLHQAKGLEATVVVLANPTDHSRRTPDSHMTRSAEGAAEGFLRVSGTAVGFRSAPDLARPLGWADRQAAEERFDLAEEVRLLYVAVTRAREELVVARWTGGRGTSPWAPLDPWLDEHAESLALQARPPGPRPEADVRPAEMRSAVAEAEAALEARGVPTFEHVTVTHLTKEDPDAGGASVRTRGTSRRADRPGDFRGFAWGSAVHGALAAAAGGVEGESLRSACRNLLVEHGRPLDDHGEPVELRELVDLVGAVRASDLWARARVSERSLAEVAFAVPGLGAVVAASPPPTAPPPTPSTPTRRQLDLFGGGADTLDESRRDKQEGALVEGDTPEGGPMGDEAQGDDTLERHAAAEREGGVSDSGAAAKRTVLEGIIDLAFREPDGWVIADYKTDVGTDPDFAERSKAYRRQVDLYADAWSHLTGERVKERVLFYTAQRRIESW